MNRRYCKIFVIFIFSFMFCGCSNIKVIKEQQKSKDEVIIFVEDDLKNKYKDVEIKLDKLDKAYTAENELIKNGNQYYFKIKDKKGNIAYASYKDAFKINDDIYDYNYLESYSAIYNNKELDYYNYLVDNYIDKKYVKEKYFAADYYDNLDLFSKVKIVYKLNYKLKDMTEEQYYAFIKLGYDLRKYKLNTYGTVKFDDPEVCFIFEDDNSYYYASYYGLADLKNNYYKIKIKEKDIYLDNYNLKNKINFLVNKEEYNKMLRDFNNIGIYLIDTVIDIKTMSDDKYGYVLIENYTKNNYLMSLLFKFKYDSITSSYTYDSMNILDTDKTGSFDGFIVNSWKNF